MSPRFVSARGALVAVVIAPLLGCAMAQAPVMMAPDPATMYGAKAQRTAFEEPTPAPASARIAGPSGRRDGTDTGDADTPPAGRDAQRTRTGLFWAGIATTALGGVMLTAFGIAGRVTQAQLKDGYEGGDLTYARENTLRDRGKAFNAVAAAGAGIGLVGAAVAAIVYGVDYSRCGTLTKRRKDCRPK